MEPERYEHIGRIYHATLQLPESAREAFLQRACGEDEGLRREVEELLAATERVGTFIESPPDDIAAGLMRSGEGIGAEHVGQYQIVSRLGEGGMGVVYRARDVRLGRTVALKFLTAGMVQNPETLERFQLEARTAAALDHPNICTVYDVGEHEGRPFIAMQYLEGDTLMQRLAHGPIATQECMDFGIQIAEGLVAAHSRGIIHRDIKPANIFITHSGTIKVLDFGLAKLTQAPESYGSAMSTSPGPDARLTSPGIAIGTVAYMSPEQALGKELDARTDLFSLGVVLYEMATGSRPFRGEAFAALTDEILHRTPVSVMRTNPELPDGLDHIINKALEKDRELRFQTAGEIMADLKRLGRDLASVKSTVSTGKVYPEQTRFPAKMRFLLAGALLFLVLLVLWEFVLQRRGIQERPEPSGQQEYRLTQITFDTGLAAAPTLSEDGTLLAYASDRAGETGLDIWVQQVPNGNPIQLTDHETDDHEPHFSPDGMTISFRSEREGGGIYLIPALGGNERLLAPRGRRPQFSPDGKHIAFWTGESPLVFSEPRIFLVPSSGGSPRPFQPDFEIASYPVWSPDAKRILFVGKKDGVDDWWIATVEGGPAIKVGVAAAFEPHGQSTILVPEVWQQDRVLVTYRLGNSVNIWQVRISPENWRVTGPAERITRGGGIESSPSATAELIVFSSLRENADIWSYPLDAKKFEVRGLPQRLTNNAALDFFPTIPADGSQIVFVSTRSGNPDVWIKDLERGEERALTMTPLPDGVPIVSQDGSWVAYRAYENGKAAIHITPTRGGVPQKVCDDCHHPWAWSPSSQLLLFGRGRFPDGIGLLDVRTNQRKSVTRHPVAGYRLWSAAFSPDERWLVFQTDNSPHARQTYVAPFHPEKPTDPEDWIAVTDGTSLDTEPRWSPDGDGIYFLSQRDGFRCLWAQPLDRVSKHAVGPPVEIHHFHPSRISTRAPMVNLPANFVGLSLSRDQFVLAMAEVTGNLWMMQPVVSE